MTGKRKALSRLLVLLAALPICSMSASAPHRDMAFVNGLWFDGTSFQSRTMIAQNGLLKEVAAVPPGAESVDLEGGFVVPPYCEGHNHNIAVGKPDERNRKYLAAGVFYAQVLNNSPDLAASERAFWDRSDTVDVVFAHGGLTGPGGHPVEILEGIRRGGGYPPGTVLADRAYFEVDDVGQLERKWPLLIAARPDIVKIFLQFSEEYEKRKNDPAYVGNRGVSPAVLRRAIELARRDGRRVAVHVTSAHDFHLAVEAGADVIAHLPGYMSVERISPKDAQEAARKRIVVIATASLAQTYPVKDVSREALKAAQIQNLKLLKDSGVTVTIGSDNWGDTSHGEIAYLRSLGVFSDLELLRSWTGTCPRSIFPTRKIGSLASGQEANFLVLEGDPLRDFQQTRRIRLMVKAGKILPKPEVSRPPA